MSAQIIPFPKVHRNGQSPTLAELLQLRPPAGAWRIEGADVPDAAKARAVPLKSLAQRVGERIVKAMPWGAK